ncbi:hypothetical protein FHX42_005304 [Saccharopolyspora lacisalsi]|uniref:Uncharacterized protein n=1 Tax=Halosaccharopolyspora lacisalsi TaxID=1000566 RepID=A0A839E876_9PSEU|nr:hypothetical protein [Halosaccharopolyspora lacisalsi]MBA8827897.1 hypothetical protein [Halosaccharopolyspora lacisalsi]
MAFRVDGVELWLPRLPLPVWLDACQYEPSGCWWMLIPGRLEEQARAWLESRIQDPRDGFDVDLLEDVATRVLGRVLGCDFWAGRRLLMAVAAEWMQFDGLAVQWGFDPLNAPVHRTVNAMWALQVQGCDEDSKRARLESEVFAGPEGPRPSGRAREAGGGRAAGGSWEARAWDAWRGGG